MNGICASLGPLRDAFTDGQIGEEDALRVTEHLQACVACRQDLRGRARLRQAVSKLALPDTPPSLHRRIVTALDRADRAGRMKRWLRWSPAAVGVLSTAALLLLVLPAGAQPPAFVRHSSDFHDRIVSGSEFAAAIADPAALRSFFKSVLGSDVTIPVLGCSVDGGCVCTMPESKTAAPWILYRRGATRISLLVLPDEGARFPASARRTKGGCEYYAFREGQNAVLVCRSGRVCHVWIARMTEQELLDTALSTPEGRRIMSGERLTLSGVTCQACCAMIEAKTRSVEGVSDAAVDMTSMELIVTGEQIDLEKVIRQLRDAGYEAAPRR